MTQGAQLSASSIAGLARRDVTKFWVLLDAAEPTADLKAREAARRQHHQARLARLFRHVGENPEGRELMNLMARYREIEPS